MKCKQQTEVFFGPANVFLFRDLNREVICLFAPSVRDTCVSPCLKDGSWGSKLIVANS